MSKKETKAEKAKRFLANYDSTNLPEMSLNLVTRLREIGAEKKKLSDEESVIKAWLREYGQSLRTEDEEKSVEVGAGATIAFQGDVPKDMTDADAEDLKEQFELFFENGAKVFKELFEKKVTWKPVLGFGEKLDAYDNQTVKKLKKLIKMKTNTPLVQS